MVLPRVTLEVFFFLSLAIAVAAPAQSAEIPGRAPAASQAVAPVNGGLADAILQVRAFAGALGSWRASQGTVSAPEVRLGRLRLTDASAKVVLPETPGAIRVEDISAAFYGGRLKGKIELDCGTKPAREGRPADDWGARYEFEAAGAQANELLRDVEYCNMNVAGLLSGKVSGARKPGEKAWRSEFRMRIEGAELGTFPLISRILSLESMSALSREKIETCVLDAAVGPQGVDIRELALLSGDSQLAFRAEPGGGLDASGRFRGLYLKPEAGEAVLKRVSIVGQLTDLLQQIQRQAMRVQVEGSLSDIRVTWAPWKGKEGEKKTE